MTFRPVKQPNAIPAKAKVTRTYPEKKPHAIIECSVMEPPDWLREMLQSRGVFIGSTTPWFMHFFKTHDGKWLDTFFFDGENPWEIEI